MPDSKPDTRSRQREIQCIELAAQGLTNREIGKELHLSEDTVKTYLARLYRRLKAKDRAHAVALLMRAGVIR